MISAVEEPDMIFCDSVECIESNTSDSTQIQFVSSEFVLEKHLDIHDLKDIQLEGSSLWNTTISCVDKSTPSTLFEVGLVFTKRIEVLKILRKCYPPC